MTSLNLPILKELKTLLITREGLGDLLMAMPAIQVLSQELKGAGVGAVCRNGFQEVLECVPELEEVLPFDQGQSKFKKHFQAKSFLKRIHESGYEQAVFLDIDKSLLSKWTVAGVPLDQSFLRISCLGEIQSLDQSQEVSYRAGYDDGYDQVPHISNQYFKFLQNLLKNDYPFKPWSWPFEATQLTQAEKLISGFNLTPQDSFWVCHPGNSSLERKSKKLVHRLWSIDSWVKVLSSFIKDKGCSVLLSGTRGEFEFHEELHDRLPQAIREKVGTLAGKTTISQLAAILKLSKGYLGLDSGPMHLAAAVGTQVVAIYGPTDPNLCGPQGMSELTVIRNAVECSPCTRKTRKNCQDNICMTRLTPDFVLNELRESGI